MKKFIVDVKISLGMSVKAIAMNNFVNNFSV